MKKLALSFAAIGLLAAPVFACPHSEEKAEEVAPRTAEKDKKEEAPKADTAKAADKTKDTAKAKDAPKTAKPAETKKADKVSQR